MSLLPTLSYCGILGHYLGHFGGPGIPEFSGFASSGDGGALQLLRDSGIDRNSSSIWLFPKIRGPILLVPIIKTIIYLGLFWGPLFMEASI